ncbi:MAG: polyamine ABC transporter substrate-binding protein [Pseudomonadota bacterium]|nr:polyamine ABC transporter substrate-binding protein [Pseudomonadota bacterium]
MKKKLSTRLKFSASVLAMAVAGLTTTAQAQEEIHFYNWSDYIAEDTVPNFEKETGIKVISDYFDSNEVLEAKLLAGNSGYDIVVPTSHFMGRQIKAGTFMPLDKSKLPNLKYIDKDLLGYLETADPGNKYGIPYLWGTTGIGYNVAMIKKILGDDAPVDSWDLVFKPENLKKLSECGVSFLDSPDEIYPLLMNYVGIDPNSLDKKDYGDNSPATKLMKELRPYVTQFHSSQYINDLANGDTCVAIGWSGDVLMAGDRAAEAENGNEIVYVIPKEGTQIWFDMMAIPADSKNPEGAYKFINYLMEPAVIAEVTNYVAYANPNTGAKEFQDPEISANPSVYPSEETKKKLFPSKIRGQKIDRILTRFWSDMKAGR